MRAGRGGCKNPSMPHANSPDRRRDRPRYGYYALPVYVLVCVAPLCVGGVLCWVGSWADLPWARGLGVGLAVYAVVQAVGCWLGVYVLPEGRARRARRVATSLRDVSTDTLVDIGAGRGVLTVEFAKVLSPRRVVAVDLWTREARRESPAYDRSAPVFAHTAERTRYNAEVEGVLDRVRFLTTDATCLGIASESVDIVTAGYVLFHLHEGGLRRSDDRRLAALREWRRVLNPGGRLVVFELTHTGWTNVLAWTPAGYVASRLFSTRLTADYWAGLIQATDIVVESVDETRGNVVIVARRPLAL